MSKSLAELRQSPRVGLPERTYRLCVAPKLVAEVQSLASEMEDAQIEESARREGDEGAVPPRRMGESPRARKIRDRLVALRDEMAEHTGALTLRGMTEGAWRIWVSEHPARDGNSRDEQIAYGCCNADDLIDDLSQFAHAWNGDLIQEGDWEFLRNNSAAADIKALASLVVVMHEMVVDVPKLLSGSLATLGNESD